MDTPSLDNTSIDGIYKDSNITDEKLSNPPKKQRKNMDYDTIKSIVDPNNELSISDLRQAIHIHRLESLPNEALVKKAKTGSQESIDILTRRGFDQNVIIQLKSESDQALILSNMKQKAIDEQRAIRSSKMKQSLRVLDHLSTQKIAGDATALVASQSSSSSQNLPLDKSGPDIITSSAHPPLEQINPSCNLIPYGTIVPDLPSSSSDWDAIHRSSYFTAHNMRCVWPYSITIIANVKSWWIGQTLRRVANVAFPAFYKGYIEHAVDCGRMMINSTLLSRNNIDEYPLSIQSSSHGNQPSSSPPRLNIDEYILQHGDIIQHLTHSHEPPSSILDEIGYPSPPSPLSSSTSCDTTSYIPIYHHDTINELIVTSKPSSLPVHSNARYRLNSLLFVLLSQYGYDKSILDYIEQYYPSKYADIIEQLSTSPSSSSLSLDAGSIPNNNNNNLITLPNGTIIDLAQHIYNKINYNINTLNVVHRLDRCTTGLVVLATSQQSAIRLTKMMQQRNVRKHYIARVLGRFPASYDDIQLLSQLQIYGYNRHQQYDCIDADDHDDNANNTNTRNSRSGSNITLPLHPFFGHTSASAGHNSGIYWYNSHNNNNTITSPLTLNDRSNSHNITPSHSPSSSVGSAPIKSSSVGSLSVGSSSVGSSSVPVKSVSVESFCTSLGKQVSQTNILPGYTLWNGVGILPVLSSKHPTLSHASSSTPTTDTTTDTTTHSSYQQQSLLNGIQSMIDGHCIDVIVDRPISNRPNDIQSMVCPPLDYKNDVQSVWYSDLKYITEPQHHSKKKTKNDTDDDDSSHNTATSSNDTTPSMLSPLSDSPRKPSLTIFRALSYDPITNTSLVHCMPRTGRTHQIRVHLEHIGYPIANDTTYGGNVLTTYDKLYNYYISNSSAAMQSSHSTTTQDGTQHNNDNNNRNLDSIQATNTQIQYWPLYYTNPSYMSSDDDVRMQSSSLTSSSSASSSTSSLTSSSSFPPPYRPTPETYQAIYNHRWRQSYDPFCAFCKNIDNGLWDTKRRVKDPPLFYTTPSTTTTTPHDTDISNNHVDGTLNRCNHSYERQHFDPTNKMPLYTTQSTTHATPPLSPQIDNNNTNTNANNNNNTSLNDDITTSTQQPDILYHTINVDPIHYKPVYTTNTTMNDHFNNQTSANSVYIKRQVMAYDSSTTANNHDIGLSQDNIDQPSSTQHLYPAVMSIDPTTDCIWLHAVRYETPKWTYDVPCPYQWTKWSNLTIPPSYMSRSDQ